MNFICNGNPFWAFSVQKDWEWKARPEGKCPKKDSPE